MMVRLPFYARITLILVGLFLFFTILAVGKSILVPFVFALLCYENSGSGCLNSVKEVSNISFFHSSGIALYPKPSRMYYPSIIDRIKPNAFNV